MKYEYQVTAFSKIANRILPRKINTIIEIGARDCAETIAFSKYFPDAKILTFECNPYTLKICRERVEDNKNIHLVEKAIGDYTGEIDFFSSIPTQNHEWNPGASSIYKVNRNLVTDIQQQKVTVPITTLKEILLEHKISSVDLLWMDIQGAELSALKGAGEYLNTIALIHSEVEFMNMYEGQPLFKDIELFLQENGFTLLTFTSMGKHSADAVFVNKRIYTPLLPRSVIFYSHILRERITGKFRVLKNQINDLINRLRTT